ncbi:MAG: signal peptidase II [bacterium]
MIDRILKWQALTEWSSVPREILPGIRFDFLLNPGIALSIPLGGTVLFVITILVLLALVVWFIRSLRRKDMVVILSLLFILVGAASNITDRFLESGVIDYIQIWFLPVFNLADLLIITGIVLILFLRSDIRKRGRVVGGGQ